MILSHRSIVSFLSIGILALSLLTLTTMPGVAGSMGDIKIQDVDTRQTGSFEVMSGLAWESGRTAYTRPGGGSAEYDNIRLHPLMIGYGYSNMIDFEGNLAYASNSADESGDPDQSGIESLSFEGKVQWNRNIATSFGLGFGIGDDVLPYGGDGLKIDLNIPGQFPLGPGMFIGELGFHSQSGDLGDVRGRGASDLGDWDSYLRYGIGYKYDLTSRWGIRTEIVGHGAPHDAKTSTTNFGDEDMLELMITPTMQVTRNSDFRPSIRVGLADGSPSFALGLDYSMRWGSTGRNRKPLSFGNEQKKQTAQQTASNRDREPLILPGEISKGPGGAQGQSTVNPRKAQQLADQGRQAFQNGNVDRAIEKYQQAVQFDPKNVEILSNLGSLYYRRQNYEEARRYYNRAVNVDSNDQFSQLYLGITHYRLDNTSKARQHLRRAKNIDPNSDAGQTASQWLNRI